MLTLLDVAASRLARALERSPSSKSVARGAPRLTRADRQTPRAAQAFGLLQRRVGSWGGYGPASGAECVGVGVGNAESAWACVGSFVGLGVKDVDRGGADAAFRRIEAEVAWHGLRAARGSWALRGRRGADADEVNGWFRGQRERERLRVRDKHAALGCRSVIAGQRLAARQRRDKRARRTLNAWPALDAWPARLPRRALKSHDPLRPLPAPRPGHVPAQPRVVTRALMRDVQSAALVMHTRRDDRRRALNGGIGAARCCYDERDERDPHRRSGEKSSQGEPPVADD